MKKLCVFVFSAVMIGQGEEIVYRDSGSEDKLSELIWNFRPLTYFGLDIKYSWTKPENNWGLFVNGIYKYGLPAESGVMEDRDWITIYPNWLTHYSVHDNWTESAHLIDFNLGASFKIFNIFLLKTYLSYHLMKYSWAATGGSFLYPDWDIDEDGTPDGDHQYLSVPLTVGTYEQTWHIFSPGISFYGEFNRFFNIELSFEITPLIWCITKDEHLMRSLVITENLKGKVFIEPSFLFSYKPTDNFVLSLFVAYREINKTRGNGTYNFEGETPPKVLHLTDQLGAGYKAFDIGITAKYSLN